MKIRHSVNKGFASVDDELGEKLVATDLWVVVEPPKEPASKTSS
jgi:hypothetical protein